MMKTMMSIAYLHFTICNAVSLVFASHQGFTFVLTWSEQSSRFSNVLVQDTPSEIVIHNAMNYRAFCFEGLEVLTFFFLSADSRCILPHLWFCSNYLKNMDHVRFSASCRGVPVVGTEIETCEVLFIVSIINLFCIWPKYKNEFYHISWSFQMFSVEFEFIDSWLPLC